MEDEIYEKVLGGHWMLRVSSKQEAVTWAKRCPATNCERLELREVSELEDFDLDPASALKPAEPSVCVGPELPGGSDSEDVGGLPGDRTRHPARKLDDEFAVLVLPLQ